MVTGKPAFRSLGRSEANPFKWTTVFYVYYLKSISFPERTYIGFTCDLKQRLLDHNASRSVYTKEFKPWKLIGFLGFDEESKALRFERHLKTNAGRVFLRRYFSNIDKT